MFHNYKRENKLTECNFLSFLESFEELKSFNINL